jgi:hypothetical protein
MTHMQIFRIIPSTQLFLYHMSVLGTPKAQVWIGNTPDGPLDNDDTRVLQERSVASSAIADIVAMDIQESTQYSGWYSIDMSTWPVGIYRFNIHTHAAVSSPDGTALSAVRDGEYSWPVFTDEVLASLPRYQQDFLYLERNDAGFCIRVEITSDQRIIAAGDGPTWIPAWESIKKKIEDHYKQKLSDKGA